MARLGPGGRAPVRVGSGRGTLGSHIRMLRTDWDGMQKDWNALVRAVMEEVGELWVEQFMPLHFRPGATNRYGYRIRSDAWKEYKRRIYGHSKPLIETGLMRDRLLANAGIRIVARATNKKASVRVKMPLPHPLNPKAGKGEIGRLDVDRREEDVMVRFAMKLLKRSIVSKVLRQKVLKRA